MGDAEIRMFERYRATRDARCREQLISRYLPLARNLAGRYACGGEPFDDLFQVACVGLVKAVDRYDPKRGSAFSSYAVPTILGEIKRHYRDTTWTLRIPHSVHDLAMTLRRVRECLVSERGRQPTVTELSEATGAGPEAIVEALGALAANETISLETAWPEDEDERTLAGAIGSQDPEFGRVEQRALLDDLFGCLTTRERRVMWLRFEDDLTQSEIGERIGVSQMAVSRMLSAALPRLRAHGQAS
jgi:RNA polymerase sigma-B factor